MKVICAYRDPASGESALEATRKVARSGDDVAIVHVVEPSDLPWGESQDEFVARAEQQIEEREAMIHQVAVEAGVDAAVVVDVATPGEGVAERIAREAAEREADIVVVVSKRASGVRGLLLGSVAQGLLHLAPCPVLVVRPDAEE